MLLIIQISVDEWFKEPMVFDPLNAGVAGSNPAKGMNVILRYPVISEAL
jgi:hypothetical protein